MSPFININYASAKEILTSPSKIMELLKDEKINPSEAELLEIVVRCSKKVEGAVDELQRYCEAVFKKSEGKKASERLIKFATTNEARVSWVLFSRSSQFIPYEKSDPFTNYFPQFQEVLTVESWEKM